MQSYYVVSSLVSPLVPLWLKWRMYRGKEDPKRVRERLGYASAKRPKGTLLWMHAASVGEANSVLLLIQKIREKAPNISILLTTGTVTSANLMKTRLPEGVIHQYVPIDTPQAALRFVRHWKPDIAFFIESELWPNLIRATDYYQAFMCIINGRMSEKSFRKWQQHPEAIAKLLRCFNIIFAQSGPDATRLEALGAKDVMYVGNLKYDAAILPCDESELRKLKNAIGERPVWLAASTHPGEESIVLEAHKGLKVTHPNLLTFIVPRHPKRGEAMVKEFGNQVSMALRSKKAPLTDQTQIYIADTMGELGLFYRLCDIVFMGGSLIKHGGQNPLEAARLSCAILTGPFTHNFAAIYYEMGTNNIVGLVANAAGIVAQVSTLLSNNEALETVQASAKQWTLSKSGTAQRLLETLLPIFELKS
jgi:3-deoxy-D-manno-octulosonic-acid transferase